MRGGSWTGRDGVTRPLEGTDFMVVAPYNIQVRQLRQTLRAAGLANVPVGTVDKFQGREAPMVFDSMATSRHAPDLILVHFLCADSFQHLHGPRSPEAYWALEYVDHCVDRVLSALPTGALERDTAVLVVSDHGFLPCDHEIRVNVRLRQLGLMKVDGEGRITESRARFVTNHGAGYVYVLDPADRASLVHDLKSELAALEGVTGVWGVADYAGLGLPSPDENPMMGELVLEAAEGYAFGDEARGDDHLGPPRYRGNHGHRPGHPDNGAFFLAVGAGVRRGAELGTIVSRDVAPTVAHLLEIKLGDVEGKLVADALV